MENESEKENTLKSGEEISSPFHLGEISSDETICQSLMRDAAVALTTRTRKRALGAALAAARTIFSVAGPTPL